MKEHDEDKRGRWRKLHLVIDVDTHEAISNKVSLASVGYSEVIPTLFNLLRVKIIASVADGAYKTKICH